MRSGNVFMLGVLVIVACGGGGGGGGGPTGVTGGSNDNGSGAPRNVTIDMRTDQDSYGYAGASTFDPRTQRLARGGTVTWTNSSGQIHNVTFDQSGSPANVPDLSTGSASRTFNETGTYVYHCSNHSGMTGTITVQ